ncbi:MAG: DUF4394 domain-containing protein, partial [Gemmatimonadaceae bacterium]|nr:DUF4394 domain-containing protein [Acetobacteraceae bacterium]
QLAAFDSATPGVFSSVLNVTGIDGQTLRGIDFRPSTGQLFAFVQPGFGQPGFSQSGSIFTIDTGTGAATFVSAVPSAGAVDYGFAFNPVPDRIRLVSGDNTNLRINPVTGEVLTDTPLAYAATDPNAGVNPTVTGVAYTNQNPGQQTSTVLYGIDAATNSLVIQNPPNMGTLNTVGSLGVSLFDFGTGPGTGFDIDGATGLAFASLTTATGSNGLYSINLATGAASFVGGFDPATTVRDLAVGTLGGNVNVPEPASALIVTLGVIGLAAARRRMQAA